MNFERVLEESFRRYRLVYKGTRPDYEIHDPRPYIVAIDDDYNVDGRGRSILGINLNYYKGNTKKLISSMNATDNEEGFRGFDMRARIAKKVAKNKEKAEAWVTSKRKKRYKTFIEEFPYLGKFIRRYKFTGPKGTGIQSQKRAVFK